MSVAGSAAPPSPSPSEASAQELGFQLEEEIHAAISAKGYECLREQDIRSRWGKTFNGVDHLVQRGDSYIFIQDKWESKGAGQRAVAQFLGCVLRIKEHLPAHSKTHIIWAAKYAPTSGGIALLEEKGALILTEHASISALAAKVDATAVGLLSGVSALPTGVIPTSKPAIKMAPAGGRTVSRMRKCEGCLHRVSVRIPTGSATYQFTCPICSYSVTTNSF